MKLYQRLARLQDAVKNCRDGKNTEWEEKHLERIKKLVDNFLPAGSGFDKGTKIETDFPKEGKLVFYTSFHHMNGEGFYDRWTDHTVTVIPSLSLSFELKIGGRDRNDIEEYIHEIFTDALHIDLDDNDADVRAPEIAAAWAETVAREEEERKS